MSIGFFTDKHHEPSDEEIRQTVGDGFSLWNELIQFIRQTYAPNEDFKFLYGEPYGWGRRFRLKGNCSPRCIRPRAVSPRRSF